MSRRRSSPSFRWARSHLHRLRQGTDQRPLVRIVKPDQVRLVETTAPNMTPGSRTVDIRRDESRVPLRSGSWTCRRRRRSPRRSLPPRRRRVGAAASLRRWSSRARVDADDRCERRAGSIGPPDQVERSAEGDEGAVGDGVGKRADPPQGAARRVEGEDRRARSCGRCPSCHVDAASERRDAGVTKPRGQPADDRRRVSWDEALDRGRPCGSRVAADEERRGSDRGCAEIRERLADRPAGLTAPVVGSRRSMASNDVVWPPPNRNTRPRSTAAAASCVATGSVPIRRSADGRPARTWSDEPVAVKPPSAAISPLGSATTETRAAGVGRWPTTRTRSCDALARRRHRKRERPAGGGSLGRHASCDRRQ